MCKYLNILIKRKSECFNLAVKLLKTDVAKPVGPIVSNNDEELMIFIKADQGLRAFRKFRRALTHPPYQRLPSPSSRAKRRR